MEAKPESAFPLKGGCRGSDRGLERSGRPMADRGVRKKQPGKAAFLCSLREPNI